MAKPIAEIGQIAIIAGDVTLNGTLGQTVIEHSEGENVVLETGYWVVKPEYVVYLPLVLRWRRLFL